MVSQLKEAAREGVAGTTTPEGPPVHHVGCPPPIPSSVSWKALTFVPKMLADSPPNHLLLEYRLMGRGSIQLENLIHEDIGAFDATGESNLDAAWVQEVATSPASCSPILLDSQHDLHIEFSAARLLWRGEGELGRTPTPSGRADGRRARTACSTRPKRSA